jgi:membrane protease YdiL (CAAX protease family)
MTTPALPLHPTDTPTSNSLSQIKTTIATGNVTWLWTLLAALSRLVLITIGIYAVYGYYVVAGHPQAWWMSLNLTNFSLVLTADLGSFLLLRWLLQREGLTFRQLLNFKAPLWKEILLGVVLTVLFLVAFYFSNIVSWIVVYGPDVFTNPPTFDSASLPQTPMWVLWWGLLVLPITVGVLEEFLYRGYLQPRLIALTNSRWLGIVLTAFFFGLQHIVLPLYDAPTSMSRFVSTFLIGLLFGVLYHRQKRLLPLIIAHWLVDVIGLGLLPLLAATMTAP